MLLGYLTPQFFLLLSLWLWASFSFISNSFLALHHVLLFLSFLLSVPYLRKRTWKVPQSVWALFAFIAVAIVSIVLNSSELEEPLLKATKLKYCLVGAMAYCLCLAHREEIKKKFMFFLPLFLLSFFVSAIYGLGMCARVVFWENSLLIRLSGLFGMVMSYANAALWPVLLSCFLLSPNKFHFSVLTRRLSVFDAPLVRWGLFLLSFVTLYLTQARGALIAVIVAIPFLFFYENKKLFFRIILFVAVLLGAASWKVFNTDYQGDVYLNRILQASDSLSNRERLSHFKVAYKALGDKPLLGQGWRSLEERASFIKNKYNIELRDTVGHAHNNFLEVLATTGVLGFIAFMLWIFFWFYEVCFKNKSIWRSYYLAAIVSFVIGGLVQSTIIDSEYAFTLFAFYGMSPLFIESSPS